MSALTLVTGANGFGGRNLCRYLAEKNMPVRGMYYPPDGQPRPIQGVEFVPGDVRRPEELHRAVAGTHYVFHLAALYRPVNVRKQDYIDVNVDGTRNMVEAAAEAKVERFVHCSTIGVHGHVEHPPANEDAPIKPDDFYQQTKYEGEVVARTLGSRLGLNITALRPAAIYGAGETRFLPLARLIKKRRFVMFGNGQVPYHFIHVDDLSQAFVRCLENKNSIGATYIIADDHAVTLNDILHIFAEALGVPAPRWRLPLAVLLGASTLCEFSCKPFGLNPPLHRRRAEWFWSTRSFDISRARRDLAFEPAVDLRDGLRQMIESYKTANWL
jgi:nucleoside-diphosphate-sugar epimerase